MTAPCPSVDAVTFGNRCGTCAGQAHGYYYGSCDDIAFVVCQETVTGFSAEEYERQVNGVCVDICPGNYDSYVTQIGVEVCIKHYGLTEIESWETCTQSTDSCNCVNAYETTTPDAIEDSVYRCVPEDYADRLIFRSGLDRLDENGERSIAIA